MFAAEEDDDVSSNPMFVELRDKQADLYALAKAAGAVVVIPQRVTLDKTDLRRATVQAHVLMPIAGSDVPTFETCDGRRVKFEHGTFCTLSGFPESRQVRVLFEESVYMDDGRPIRVVVTERPLIGGRPPPPPPPALHRLEECTLFLDSLPNAVPVLRQMRERITQFNVLYNTVPGFETHAASVLAALVRDTAALVLKTTSPMDPRRALSWFPRAVNTAVECLAMSGTYDKIFGALRDQLRGADAAALRFCTGVAAHSPSADLSEALRRADPRPAAQVLRTIDTQRTPLDKLRVISDTVAVLMDGVRMRPEAAPEAISGDDMVPLMHWLMGAARLPHIASTATYLQAFTPAAAAGQALYYIATFVAAAEYAVRGGQAEGASEAADASEAAAAAAAVRVPSAGSAVQPGSPAPPASPSMTSAAVTVAKRTDTAGSVSVSAPSTFAAPAAPAPTDRASPTAPHNASPASALSAALSAGSSGRGASLGASVGSAAGTAAAASGSVRADSPTPAAGAGEPPGDRSLLSADASAFLEGLSPAASPALQPGSLPASPSRRSLGGASPGDAVLPPPRSRLLVSLFSPVTSVLAARLAGENTGAGAGAAAGATAAPSSAVGRPVSATRLFAERGSGAVSSADGAPGAGTEAAEAPAAADSGDEAMGRSTHSSPLPASDEDSGRASRELSVRRSVRCDASFRSTDSGARPVERVPTRSHPLLLDPDE